VKYWFDTEFHEDGRTIDLISIGVVAEDGRQYYAVSLDFNRVLAFDHPWLAENVLPHLPWMSLPPTTPLQWATADVDLDSGWWKHREKIRDDLLRFCDPEQYGKPEFWAYYADYDWVALCQLFGRMIDLPNGWPMYCRDLKQEADRKEADFRIRVPEYKLQLPPQDSQEHHALADARWNRVVWEYLKSLIGVYTVKNDAES
jgi:hypothetical protein